MKVMIHAHTTFSADGELTPKDLAILARKRGFDAVMVSDHFESLRQQSFEQLVTECSQIRECLMVPGYERSFRGYHVLALGICQWFNDANIENWTNKVRAAGGITAVAHPSRYNHTIPADILESCDAVEVWNSKFFYDGELGPNPRAFKLLGTKRYPLCSQDLHGTRHASPVGIKLREKCATGQAIVSQLQSGAYHMTNGLFTFDKELSAVSESVLNTFHVARRRAVSSAVKLRRWIRGRKNHD